MLLETKGQITHSTQEQTDMGFQKQLLLLMTIGLSLIVGCGAPEQEPPDITILEGKERKVPSESQNHPEEPTAEQEWPSSPDASPQEALPQEEPDTPGPNHPDTPGQEQVQDHTPEPHVPEQKPKEIHPEPPPIDRKPPDRRPPPTFPYYPKGIPRISASGKSALQKLYRSGQTKGLRGDVFAKIGDSHTVSNQFMAPFATKYVKLDKYTYLQAIIKQFSTKKVDASTTSFNRKSLCAVVGWSTNSPLKGSPNRLAQELKALRPAFAFVLYGSNDAYVFPNGSTYQNNLEKILKQIIANGTIPILSTVPDVGSKRAAKLPIIARFNTQVKALAQKHQIPLIDLNAAFKSLPSKGLSSDHLHFNAYKGWLGGYFILDAMRYGANVRNKLSLDTLHKLRQIVVLDGPADR